jgi:hypothetical protein
MLRNGRCWEVPHAPTSNGKRVRCPYLLVGITSEDYGLTGAEGIIGYLCDLDIPTSRKKIEWLPECVSLVCGIIQR